VTAWLTAALAVERYVLVCHAARAKQLFGAVRSQQDPDSTTWICCGLAAQLVVGYIVLYCTRNPQQIEMKFRD